jgi:hypothetical protein
VPYELDNICQLFNAQLLANLAQTAVIKVLGQVDNPLLVTVTKVECPLPLRINPNVKAVVTVQDLSLSANAIEHGWFYREQMRRKAFPVPSIREVIRDDVKQEDKVVGRAFSDLALRDEKPSDRALTILFNF